MNTHIQVFFDQLVKSLWKYPYNHIPRCVSQVIPNPVRSTIKLSYHISIAGRSVLSITAEVSCISDILGEKDC